MSEFLDAAVAVGTLGTAIAAAAGVRSAATTATTAERQLAADWQPLLLDVPVDERSPRQPSFRLPDGRRVEVPEAADPTVEGSAIVQATGDFGDYVVAPFRNAGGGVARIVELTLFVRNSEIAAAKRVERQFVAPGEATRAIFALAADSPDRGTFVDCARQLGSALAVGVAYTDLSGSSRGEVIFDLAREVGRGWHVANVSHHVLPVPLRRTIVD